MCVGMYMALCMCMGLGRWRCMRGHMRSLNMGRSRGARRGRVRCVRRWRVLCMCMCVRTGWYIGRCVGRGGVAEDLRVLLLEVHLWGRNLLVMLLQWLLLLGEWRVL